MRLMSFSVRLLCGSKIYASPLFIRAQAGLRPNGGRLCCHSLSGCQLPVNWLCFEAIKLRDVFSKLLRVFNIFIATCCGCLRLFCCCCCLLICCYCCYCCCNAHVRLLSLSSLCGRPSRILHQRQRHQAKANWRQLQQSAVIRQLYGYLRVTG